MTSAGTDGRLPFEPPKHRCWDDRQWYYGAPTYRDGSVNRPIHCRLCDKRIGVLSENTERQTTAESV